MTDNPLWQYSLAHYARREVAETCLALQDGSEANVNLLLFCCWLGCRGELLTSGQLAEARLLVGEWDRGVVQPLRQVRRFLKQSADTDQMLAAVSALELKAERIVQDRLVSWWLAVGGNPERPGGERVVAEWQRQNLALYLASLPAPPLPEDSPLCWPLTAPLSQA
ncbi:TIGR02444 family protein [Porticoccus sp.]